jgi:spore germination protein YaaH
MIPWSIYDECQQRLQDGSMDERLREIISSRSSYSLADLTTYLYYTNKQDLPSWQPLLVATLEETYLRGCTPNQGLLALMPSAKVVQRNTDGLS